MSKIVLWMILLLIPSLVFAQETDGELVLIGKKGEILSAYQPCEVAQANCDSAKLNKVEIDPFYIDKYEVTWGDVQTCYASGLCKNIDKLKLVLENEANIDAKKNIPFAMSHDQAKAYCKARGMRLPTPTEWLLAAMGDVVHRYPWAEDNKVDGMFADELSDVGQFPHDVSPWGVYDMGGNAVEWVEGRPMGVYEPGYKCADPRTWPAMGNVRRVFIYEQFGVGLWGYEGDTPTARCVKNVD